MKNQKTISKARPIRKKKKKTKNQTHHSNTHQKKSKNKVARAVGLGGRPNPGRPDPRCFHPRATTGSTHPRPTTGSNHRFHPPAAFLLPSSGRGLHLSSSFSSFSFLSSYNQVVWFYFDNVFHVEVADDEWLAQKVFFVQYISYSLID
jgi:hypothetical protein